MRVIKDWMIIVLLFCASLATAYHYLSEHTPTRQLHANYFEPAVMLACGKGLGNFNGHNQALNQFLAGKSKRFSCQELPVDASVDQHIATRTWYYLLITTAAIWKTFGISWANLNILSLLLFAIAMSLLYGIFRLGMGKTLATIATLAFIIHESNLFYLIAIRDYGKVPFIYAGILLLGTVVKYRISSIKLVVIAISYGLLVAIGYSFRPDVLALIIPFIVTILVFLPKQRLKHLPRNLLLLILFALSLYFTALPILKTHRSAKLGSCLWHHPLIGTTMSFSKQLGHMPATYGWGYQFTDQMIYVMVAAYGQHFLSTPATITPCSRQYDKVSGNLVKTLVVSFPNDIIVRAYGAILRVLDHLNVFYLSLIILLLLASVNFRYAIFLLLMLLYFFSYLSIQIMPRHFFHMLFWQYWAWGFLLQLIITHGVLADNRKKTLAFLKEKSLWPYIKRSCYFAIISFTCLALLLITARLWQVKQVKRLITSYLDAKTTALDYQKHYSLKTNRITYQFKWPNNLIANKEKLTGSGEFNSKMLALRIGGQRCHAPVLNLDMQYQVTLLNKQFYDYSRHINITLNQLSKGPYHLFIPLYFSYGDISPRGIKAHQVQLSGGGFPYGFSVPRAQAACISAIAEVETKTLYPMWLYLAIAPNWQSQILYQRLPL